jgi:hypothetical protein
MKPDKSQDTRWIWLQMTRGPKLQHENLQGLNQARRSLDRKIQALTVKETTSKVHMQVHTNKKSHEK